ncbi:MAG: hypothetical protein WEA58_03935 [Balneolaceae bacterium]
MIKRLYETHQAKLFLAALVAGSIYSLYIGFEYFAELTIFLVVLTMFSVVLVIGVLIDQNVLRGIDTLHEIKEGNNAVAITILALAVLFLACAQFM